VRANVARTVLVIRNRISESFQAITDQARETDIRRRAAAEILFAYWAAKTSRNGNVFYDEKRESRLVSRLRENDDNLSELLFVVDGALKDDFLAGRETGKKQLRIETIFRDRSQVERLSEGGGYVVGVEHALLRKHRAEQQQAQSEERDENRNGNSGGEDGVDH
jgi:chorismate mutase